MRRAGTRRLNLEPTRFTESLEEHAEPQRRTWVYQRFVCLRVFMSVQVMHRSLLTLCFGLSASQAGAEMGDLSLFSRQGRVLYHMVSWAQSALDTQESVGARSNLPAARPISRKAETVWGLLSCLNSLAGANTAHE